MLDSSIPRILGMIRIGNTSHVLTYDMCSRTSTIVKLAMNCKSLITVIELIPIIVTKLPPIICD